MAIYRNVQLSFWTDTKVTDEFTPEDKYFYLYLLTNPHTNTSGCYELSIRQMSIETGYSQETIERLIERFALVHKVMRYSRENKEVLLVNWHKYNWTTSDKLRISIYNNIKVIKTKCFKDYLLYCYDNSDDEECSLILNEEVNMKKHKQEEPTPDTTQNSTEKEPPKKESKPIVVKHRYGTYNHITLTDDEYARLIKDYGEEAVTRGIKKVDEYCQETGKRYKDYNLTLRRWGIEDPKLNVKDEPSDSDAGQIRRQLQ